MKKQAEMTLEAETVEESTEVAAPVNAAPVVADSPEGMIRYALDRGASVEVMEKMFDLSEKMRAVQAKREFDEAMSDFQMQCPMVKKARKGGVSKYAALEDVVGQTKSILKEHGFSYSLNTRVVDGKLFAVCFAKHKGGHTEESSFPCTPITGTNAMSEIMKVSSAVTFAKRQCFINAFGIICCDEDNDGHGGKTPDAPDFDAADLRKRLKLATAKIHGCKPESNLTQDGLLALSEWLRENKIILKGEVVATLSGDRLKAVVEAAERAAKL